MAQLESMEQVPADELKAEIHQLVEKNARNPGKSFLNGFDHHAELIKKQVIEKGFCTKSQLEYLVLYNQQVEADKRCLFDPHTQKKTKIFIDKPREEQTVDEKRFIDDLTVYKPLFDSRTIQEYFDKNFSNLSPENARKAEIKQLLKDLART